MTVHHETERKYRVPDAEVMERLLQLQQVGSYAVGAFRTCHVVDTYYDTPERSFAAAGYAFRFRQSDREQTVHLKSLTPPSEEGVHRRVELHAATGQPELPSAWPEGPARHLALETLGDQNLAPLFRIEQVRHIAPLSAADKQAAEMSLDEVRWLTGERDCRAIELEIELCQGQGEWDLEAVTVELATIWQLQPELRSKYERGLEWASSIASAEPDGDPDGAGPFERAEPRKRPGIPFQADDPVAAFVQRVLAAQTDKLRSQRDGVVKDEGVEAVHDARVATRRMRSVLYFFTPWLPKRAAKELRRELRQAARALGAVRDLDVSLAFVHEHAPQVAPEAEVPLRHHLEVERRRARAGLLEYYKGSGYKSLDKALSQFARAKGSGQNRLDAVLPGLVDQAATEVHVFGRTLVPGSPIEHLHALRIAVKHLRYLLEFTRYSSFPEGDPLITLLTDVQEELGQVHDAHVSCLLAFDLLRRTELPLTAGDRDALLAYGLGLGRYRDARAAPFLASAPPPPWGVWLDPATQAQLGEIRALLGGERLEQR